MKRSFRAVLRTLRGYLVKNLHVNDEVVDELLSSLALNETDAEIIEHEKSNRDKIKRIILSLSPKDDTIYYAFKECLKKTKNDHVLKKIEETESGCASEVAEHTEATQQIILEYFKADSTETFISLCEIQDILLSDQTSRYHEDFVDDVLDTEWITDIIRSLFPGSQEGIVSTSSRRGKKKKGRKRNKSSTTKTEFGFYGIGFLCGPDEEYTRQRQESESSQFSDTEIYYDECTNYTKPKFIDLSVHEFYLWLKQVLEKHCNDSSAAEKFKDDDIDGSVFNEMSDAELREYLPKLGQRKKVQMMWAEYIANSTDLEGNTAADRTNTGCKASDGKIITQSIRPFDCPNSYKHKYLHGAFVPISEARRGNPLCPVHTYLPGNRGKLLSTKDTTALAVEIVKFGSACMNDKTNGTIHFGIACNGEIKGCSVDSKVFERKVTKCIRKSFYDGQISIALNCIRPPQFIEVIGENNSNETLYVIEVDVVSSTKFVEDFAFFLKPANDDESDSPIYRYDKEMKCLKPREIDLYMKDEKNKLYLARKELEEIQLKHPDVNCFQRLKDFLCCGNEQFEQSIYPLLILNTVNEHENENFEFMKHIQWRAVFDFNKYMENGNVREYLEQNHGMVFNVNFIEDFDPKKMKESTMKQTIENLKSTSLPNWIYCNGPTQECNVIVDPTQWKMERSGSFRKAIEFYVDNIPQGRGRVLIPLFCNENSLLVEAAEEFLLNLETVV